MFEKEDNMKCIIRKDIWEFYDYEEFPTICMTRMDKENTGRWVIWSTLTRKSQTVMAVTPMKLILDIVKDIRVSEIKILLESNLLDRGYRLSEAKEIVEKTIKRYYGGNYV
jgi:hypothetical protein